MGHRFLSSPLITALLDSLRKYKEYFSKCSSTNANNPQGLFKAGSQSNYMQPATFFSEQTQTMLKISSASFKVKWKFWMTDERHYLISYGNTPFWTMQTIPLCSQSIFYSILSPLYSIIHSWIGCFYFAFPKRCDACQTTEFIKAVFSPSRHSWNTLVPLFLRETWYAPTGSSHTRASL